MIKKNIKIDWKKKDMINQSTLTAMLVSYEIVYNIYIIQEGINITIIK